MVKEGTAVRSAGSGCESQAQMKGADNQYESTMTIRHRNRFLVLTLLLAALGACSSPQSTTIATDGAARLDGWDGVNNLFQDGNVYFAGQPDAASLKRLATEAGIKTVVNIRYPEELSRLAFDEISLVDSLGMRYVSIPVSPASFSVDDVDRLAAVLSGTDEPVLVHCASSNRVGGIWSAYLVRNQGVDIDHAIEIGKTAGLRSPGMIEAVRRVAGE